jgi:hypothetical protein
MQRSSSWLGPLGCSPGSNTQLGTRSGASCARESAEKRFSALTSLNLTPERHVDRGGRTRGQHA